MATTPVGLSANTVLPVTVAFGDALRLVVVVLRVPADARLVVLVLDVRLVEGAFAIMSSLVCSAPP